MTGVVPRSEWGARPPKAVTPLSPSLLRGVAVHYSASNADEQAEHRNCAARVLGIQRFHMDTRGWNDIAYNFLVCKHGAIFVGRGWGVRSAAQGTNPGNDGYHAVCFLGDDTSDRDDVTDPGRAALVRVIREARRRFPHAKDVKPHSFFKQTGCPGNELRAWIVKAPWESATRFKWVVSFVGKDGAARKETVRRPAIWATMNWGAFRRGDVNFDRQPR